MADLTQTPANVRIAASNAQGLTTELVQVGENVVAGEPVYLKPTDQKHWKSDNTTAEKANARGIILMPQSADGWTVIGKNGYLNVGATLDPGVAYEVSANAGKIATNGDAASATYLKSFGIAHSASIMKLNFNDPPVLLP